MPNRRVGRPRVAGNFRCPRCDQTAKKHRATWPEGPICASCYVRAVETFGACASCERHGMLPGFDVDHRPICRACANISTDLDCQTCGEEAELIRRKRCARCVLREDLNALLSPNDPPDLSLKRLVAVLCSVERPASLLTWMRSPAPRALLTSIGQRALALEHQAFDALPRSNAVEHLRSILVAHGMLPERGHVDLARFDLWVDRRLLDLAVRPRVAAALEPFARWHHLRRLHDNADTIRNMNFATRAAKQEITEAGKLLTWLDDVHDVAFADAEQQQIDEYLSTGPTTRKTARNFINWNRTIGATTLRSGRRRTAISTPVATDTERLKQLARLLAATDAPLIPRAVGLLLLLYGTPIGRLVQLRRDVVTEAPDGMRIDLGGTQPALVPAGISEVMYAVLTAGAPTRTTTVDGGWLFPGLRAGHHVHADSVHTQLRSLDITVRAGRNAALADLTQQIHPAALAEILGYSQQTLTGHALRAGLAFASYPLRGAQRSGNQSKSSTEH